MARQIPPIDMTVPAGRKGLTQRQQEQAMTRPPKSPKTFRASVRLSAEDLTDALAKTDRLEELARELGMDVRVYAIGGGQPWLR